MKECECPPVLTDRAGIHVRDGVDVELGRPVSEVLLERRLGIGRREAPEVLDAGLGPHLIRDLQPGRHLEQREDAREHHIRACHDLVVASPWATEPNQLIPLRWMVVGDGHLTGL
ncbi:MAG: hypothetical protein CO030_03870 [Candidatus Magasanikbacteria bacterium CG_4_9_14_0_2_um_filter_42_11]|uniref:Uncharacterized protein n=1 Tax=Candidatus Magasanikbacteria bacterium CG_4_9_14_0_2_um_filter_42_11 TaxID=1974643 RepID=A0A2M8F929_9BACT|nr:MAG: hypothetical protein COU34_03575 [Candidatus Magasanikbacteria bacterium CG10_big_fil_rev_8_21_14_0_10_43_9]PIY92378.1 MAG: hypothetical protein COY70_03500 [Candidatus Magasanikbacteria bacterium CG_4_10_14_0_8_um_filter_42_12]PJC52230.1 MAG: hypothetical protein CO030_03870 [Candidatus Magasanikbacteria bacterium CG_4_9_14_0_2_um_filter_42_11]